MTKHQSNLYAQRAAARINQLLDEAGAPAGLPWRSNFVAAKLGISQAHAQVALAGTEPWTWDWISAACTAYKKQPGFFLDEVLVAGVPSDTKVVSADDCGETMVLRPPPGFIQKPEALAAQWRYTRSHSGSPEIPRGDIVVYAELPAAGEYRLQRGASYVIDSEAGIALMRCTEVRSSVSTFAAPDNPALSFVIANTPFPAHRAPDMSPRIAGSLLASIRTHL